MAERVLTKVLENVHDVSLLYRQATGNIITPTITPTTPHQ
jgi:hypothetical protein